jgi:hypothetical protein
MYDMCDKHYLTHLKIHLKIHTYNHALLNFQTKEICYDYGAAFEASGKLLVCYP